MFIDNASELTSMPEEASSLLSTCCQSIEGLCYMKAMVTGPLKGFSVLRCLQFTKYMDCELSLRGFNTQTKEIKQSILQKLNLLVDDCVTNN